MNNNKLVLVIDDNPENIKLAGKILKKNDIEVLTSMSGSKGIKIAAKKKPDLILLDIMMPEMDGFETAEKIKNMKEIKNIPIIFLTAKSLEQFIEKAFNKGGVDYVMKPFNKNELLARVNMHIELKNKTEDLKKAYSIIEDKNRELEKKVITDQLTQQFTRTYILSKIDEEIKRYRRYNHDFSVIMGDIDKFKLFNDKYGHDCGDYVLKAVSNILKLTLREQDILSRWGGEEFLMLLPETDLKFGTEVANRLCEEIRNSKYTYGSLNLSVTMSFGVANFLGKESVDELIKRADNKLYEAKESGRDQVK